MGIRARAGTYLMGSCDMRADISKRSAEDDEEEQELASSAISEEEAAEVLDVASESESEAEPMSSSCSSYAILGIHAARPASRYASI
jgi:hypothetical protein